MIFWYDEKQFWEAYKKRKGYVLNRESAFVAKEYDDMMLFICELLPLNAGEVATFGYRRFFSTLKLAQKEGRRREQAQVEMKSKNKRRK